MSLEQLNTVRVCKCLFKMSRDSSKTLSATFASYNQQCVKYIWPKHKRFFILNALRDISNKELNSILTKVKVLNVTIELS